MRFCTHCGAQIPDNAKFCTACGTPVDAPDEATVVISDPEEEVVDASDVEGEFTAASWSPEPAQKPAPAPKPTPQPQPQAAPVTPVQPVVNEAPKAKKKGFFSYVWLFLKVIIIAIAAVMLAVFLHGVYIGYTSSSDDTNVTMEDDGFQSLDNLSPAERDEYTKSLMARTGDSKPATVKVGPVKFLLAGDYRIASREHLQNGESCIIVPKGASNMNNRLKVVIVPGEQQDIMGFTSEEIYYILSRAVEDQVDDLTKGKYDIHYEDNADHKYFPHCYTFLNLNISNKLFYTYTEATLVSGNLLSGCAVATTKGELAALMDIYSAVVAGAFI